MWFGAASLGGGNSTAATLCSPFTSSPSPPLIHFMGGASKRRHAAITLKASESTPSLSLSDETLNEREAGKAGMGCVFLPSG